MSKAPKINWHKAWSVRAVGTLHGAEGKEEKKKKTVFKTFGQQLLHLIVCKYSK